MTDQDQQRDARPAAGHDQQALVPRGDPTLVPGESSTARTGRPIRAGSVVPIIAIVVLGLLGANVAGFLLVKDRFITLIATAAAQTEPTGTAPASPGP